MLKDLVRHEGHLFRVGGWGVKRSGLLFFKVEVSILMIILGLGLGLPA